VIREVICDKCDKRCLITTDTSNDQLECYGSLCNDGIKYATVELSNKAIFTTLVRVKGSNHNVVPVKSSKPLDKKLWVECSKALSRVYVGVPIKAGDIICKNILNTGADIICTKNID